MNLIIQIRALFLSFLYGIIFNILFITNKNLLLSKNKIFKIIINILFMIDNVLIYFILLRFINKNILHYTFFIMFILGFLFSNYYFMNTLHTLKRKIDYKKLKW